MDNGKTFYLKKKVRWHMTAQHIDGVLHFEENRDGTRCWGNRY